jgi:hypothetical protein
MRKPGTCWTSASRWSARSIPSVSPGCSRRFPTMTRAVVRLRALGDPVDEQVRQHARVERPRPEQHQVRRPDRLEDPGSRGGVRGVDPDAPDAGRDRDGGLALDLPARRLRDERDRHRRRRQDTPLRADERAEGLDRSDQIPVVLLQQAEQQEVAEAVAGELTASEAPPGERGDLSVTGGEREQGHAQVTERHYVVIASQATGRAAVVSDGDHRAPADRQATEGRQRTRASVPTADGDDGWEHGRGSRGGHSAPRSRWTVRTVIPLRPSRCAGDVLGDRDGAMLAAGATDRDREVALALGDVAGQCHVEQPLQRARNGPAIG